MSAAAGARRLTLLQARQYLVSFGVAVQANAPHRWRRRGEVAPGVPVTTDAAGRETAALADLEDLAIRSGWCTEPDGRRT